MPSDGRDGHDRQLHAALSKVRAADATRSKNHGSADCRSFLRLNARRVGCLTRRHHRDDSGHHNGLGADLSPESLSMDKIAQCNTAATNRGRELGGRGVRINFFGSKRLVKNNFQVDREEREASRIAASSARKTLL
jgi:hypothetical protein